MNDEFLFEPEPLEETPVRSSRAGDGDDPRLQLALQLVKQAHQTLGNVMHLLESGDTAKASRDLMRAVVGKKTLEQSLEQDLGMRTIEGLFDGVYLVSSEGTRHVVPENYASKSKLVEGDVLKLTVRPDGSHVFKQIGPVDRKRLVGRLGIDSVMNNPIVMVGEDVYNVLQASVSYHKGVSGDEVIILVPGGSTKATWAALERIVTHS